METIYFRSNVFKGERPVDTLPPLQAPEAEAESSASLKLIALSLTPAPGEVFVSKPFAR